MNRPFIPKQFDPGRNQTESREPDFQEVTEVFPITTTFIFSQPCAERLTMQVDPVQAIMQLVGWLDPSLTNRAITVAVVSPRMIDAWCRGQFRRRLISENGDSFEQQVLHHINQLVV